MPRISLLDKPFGGLATDFLQPNTVAVEGGVSQYSQSTGVNIFNPGKPGHVGPAEVFDKHVPDSTLYLYAVSIVRAEATSLTRSGASVNESFFMTGGKSGAAPRIVRSTTFPAAFDASQTITAHAGANFTTVPSTGYWGEDIKYYRANNNAGVSKNYIFYSWNDSANGDVGRYDIDAQTYDDDFMATLPVQTGTSVYLVAAVPHRIAEGADRHLYISNGQYVAQYKGASGNYGTFNNAALNIGEGWVISDIKRYGNYLAILSNRIGASGGISITYVNESKLSLWDGFSTNPNFVYFIPDTYASAMIILSGMYVFTQGRNGTVKLFPFEGQGFGNPLFECSSDRIGTAPLPNCVDYYRGNFVWSGQSSSGYVCAYGPVNSKTKGLHIPYVATNGTSTATEIGLIKNINGSTLYAGVKFVDIYKLAYVVSGDTYLVNGSMKTRLYVFPHASTIKKFLFYFSQMGTGGSIRVSLYKDYDSTTDLLQNATISFAKTGSQKYVPLPVNLTGIDSFYLDITFNHVSISNVAAIIRKLEMDYEPTTKT